MPDTWGKGYTGCCFASLSTPGGIKGDCGGRLPGLLFDMRVRRLNISCTPCAGMILPSNRQFADAVSRRWWEIVEGPPCMVQVQAGAGPQFPLTNTGRAHLPGVRLDLFFLFLDGQLTQLQRFPGA